MALLRTPPPHRLRSSLALGVAEDTRSNNLNMLPNQHYMWDQPPADPPAHFQHELEKYIQLEIQQQDMAWMGSCRTDNLGHSCRTRKAIDTVRNYGMLALVAYLYAAYLPRAYP